MTNREKIIAKAKSLLKMTVKNGCTPSEAETAKKLVKELKNKYNLTLEELGLSSTQSSSHNTNQNKQKSSANEKQKTTAEKICEVVDLMLYKFRNDIEITLEDRKLFHKYDKKYFNSVDNKLQYEFKIINACEYLYLILGDVDGLIASLNNIRQLLSGLMKETANTKYKNFEDFNYYDTISKILKLSKDFYKESEKFVDFINYDIEDMFIDIEDVISNADDYDEYEDEEY